MIKEIIIENWKDYSLLDIGNFKKLEKFGNYILIRPEPQALWRPKWSESKWNHLAHVEFIQKGSNSGIWKKYKNIPEKWQIQCPLDKHTPLHLKLSLTGFKHIGAFPEQSTNWKTIYQFLKKIPDAQMLNLFAYTGAASIAGALAGAKVTHVDSIKQIISWANENAQLNNIHNIRWIVDDALSFVKRQSKKNNLYHCIVLDPPAYGHGPSGEKWKLEERLNEMMELVFKLLNPEKHLLILNAYSLGLSSLIARNLISEYAHKHQSQIEYGELSILSETNYLLPLGIFGKLIK